MQGIVAGAGSWAPPNVATSIGLCVVLLHRRVWTVAGSGCAAQSPKGRHVAAVFFTAPTAIYRHLPRAFSCSSQRPFRLALLSTVV